MLSILPIVFLNIILVAGTALKLIKQFGECGGSIEGACVSGTRCSSGVPSYCFPVDHYNSSAPIKEIVGYGRPTTAFSDISNDNAIPVWTGCVDPVFSGPCVTIAIGCDTCISLPAPWRDSLSSISILSTIAGCNFWVADNCVGDGINIDSLAIFDLGATNYNDRIVAFNCYAR